MKENVCSWNKYGYCKHGDKCNFKHNKLICVEKNCNVFKCENRHPRKCNFYREFGKCKFTSCAFSHEKQNDVKENNQKILEIENKLREIDKVTNQDDSTVVRNNMENKLEAFEKEVLKKLEAYESKLKIFHLDKSVKETKIANLEKQLNDMENKLKEEKNKSEEKDSTMANFERRLNEIENKLTEIHQENDTLLNESIVNLESSVKDLEKELFKCSKCNFTTSYKRGLKVHMKRKHTNFEEEEYPRTCDFCDVKDLDRKEMEKHLKEHTFKKLIYKCEDCDFFAPNELSLEVHAGKKHSGNFECGLCDFTGTSLENLELHQFTCEIYTCCDLNYTEMGALKKHLNEKHKKHIKYVEILHSKMDRKNFENVSSRTIQGSYLL